MKAISRCYEEMGCKNEFEKYLNSSKIVLREEEHLKTEFDKVSEEVNNFFINYFLNLF